MGRRKKPKEKRKVGRPTDYNKEIVDKIIAIVAEGNYYDTACDALEIGRTTFKRWRKEHPEFRSALKKADSDAETFHIKKINKGDKGWQSSAWFLERKKHNHWGRKDIIPLPPTPPKDEPINFSIPTPDGCSLTNFVLTK